MKKTLVAFDAVQLATVRICIASIAFSPFIVKYWKQVDWSKWKYIAIVGFTGSGIPAFMYAFAQTEISSSVTGILNSLTPIFTFVIGIVLFRADFSWSKMTGVILGFIGAASLVLFSNDGTQGSGNYWFSLLVVIGTVCYGLSVNTINRYLKDVKSIIVASLSFGFIGIPAVIYLLFAIDFSETFHHPDFYMSMAAVFALSFFGTFLATVYFFDLVKETDAVFASSVAYIMPAVALIWGFIDGEIMSIMHILSMVLIVGGVYLIKK